MAPSTAIALYEYSEYSTMCTLCSNENRVPMAIYYHLAIPWNCISAIVSQVQFLVQEGEPISPKPGLSICPTSHLKGTNPKSYMKPRARLKRPPLDHC